MTLDYWYVFPISVMIATVAMASGVEGATFFAPFFILALGLEPEVAIGTGLITEVFGFASGLFAYSRKSLIDYRLGMALLMVTIPMGLLGAYLAGVVDPLYLKSILGVGLLALGVSFLRTPDHQQVLRLDQEINTPAAPAAETVLVTADGEEIRYTVCNRTEGRIIAGVGGLFMGMVSTGLGEMNGYFLLQRCRVPSKVAVATSVFVVAVTALIASSGHFVRFVRTGGSVLDTVISLVTFTIPAVILGGQLGARLATRIPQKVLERSLGVLFVVVAALTLGQALLTR